MPFKTVKDQKGKFYAWFTDDPRRIPVKLQGGVILGSIVGKLVKWQDDDKPMIVSPEYTHGETYCSSKKIFPKLKHPRGLEK